MESVGNPKRQQNRKRGRRGETETEEERENVDILYSGPSLMKHPLHHHHPEKTKQCPNIVVEGSRGEGKGVKEGGREEN